MNGGTEETDGTDEGCVSLQVEGCRLQVEDPGNVWGGVGSADVGDGVSDCGGSEARAAWSAGGVSDKVSDEVSERATVCSVVVIIFLYFFAKV